MRLRSKEAIFSGSSATAASKADSSSQGTAGTGCGGKFGASELDAGCGVCHDKVACTCCWRQWPPACGAPAAAAQPKPLLATVTSPPTPKAGCMNMGPQAAGAVAIGAAAKTGAAIAATPMPMGIGEVAGDGGSDGGAL